MCADIPWAKDAEDDTKTKTTRKLGKKGDDDRAHYYPI
jgi:hypothetical protein